MIYDPTIVTMNYSTEEFCLIDNVFSSQGDFLYFLQNKSKMIRGLTVICETKRNERNENM